METILFYILASVVVVSALAAITRINPAMCAVWILTCLVASAGLFWLLSAPVVAVFELLPFALLAAAVAVIAFYFPGAIFFEAQSRIVSFTKVIGAMAAAYLGIVLLLSIVKPPFAAAPESGDTFESASTLMEILTGVYAPVLIIVGSLFVVTAIVAVVLLRAGEEI